MRTIFRTMSITTLGAAMFVTLFVSNASAGCGDVNLQAPFQYASPSVVARLASPVAKAETALGSGMASPSIVGLWKIQFVSMGNTGHNPSIPDGALIDFGYTQWHSDGTEILNSGGHAPATQNFCLGVWGQTGFLTFVLNHFPMSYNATSGALANYINIREQVTLSPSGDAYTGTFTINIYDTSGNQVDHLAGNIVATRLTVDSALPSAAAGN